MIQRFAANEDRMVQAILGYSFEKSVRIEEIGPDNRPSGQLEVVTQLHFADGKLYEKPLRRAPSTLHFLDLERGDTNELVAPTPLFPLTTAQLPHYVITYGGEQPLDQLTAYYFKVAPRELERAHAYFSGVVWVDKQDLVIVKTMGKWVTEIGDVTAPGLPFSVFETYRQEVAKKVWFPAYSRSDEDLDRDSVQVPIRMIVRWSNFKPLGAATAEPTQPAQTPSPSAPATNAGDKP
jgi:hypothetical protein